MFNKSYSNQFQIAIAIIAGLVAAFHMGKIPGALPFLNGHFHLSLPQSGLVVSSFSLLAAVLGLVTGMVSARLGMFHAGLLGLLLISLGSFFGGISNQYHHLLGSRILEGIGFVLVVVTMPGLINHISLPSNRAIAMGIWGAFIPAAMSLMLLTSPPIIQIGGWQGLWFLLSAISILWACIFFGTFYKVHLPSKSAYPTSKIVGSLFRKNPLLLVATFTCYSCLFAAVTAFLPTYWISNGGIDTATASRIAAVAVAGNIAGNIVAGILIGRGASLRLLLGIAMSIGGLCAVLVYLGIMPFYAEAALATGFTFFAGLLPGATFASIRNIVTQPSTIPLLVGMIFQGAGIGQVIGPIGISSMVSYGDDWIYGAIFILVVTICGAMFASQIRDPSHSTT